MDWLIVLPWEKREGKKNGRLSKGPCKRLWETATT